MEAELIGVDDALPQISWTRYFLEKQGYTITKNILFQDNKSAIIMETKRKTANSTRTKHIKIRYFFITDGVNKNEVNIDYSLLNICGQASLPNHQKVQNSEMRAHLMNHPISYYKQSATECITWDMHALMENQAPDLPLKVCIGTITNVKHMPVARQT